jgi:translocator protein
MMVNPFRVRDVAKLVACIILCQLAGVIGSVFTISSIPKWYAGLNKPFFSPPNWVFGPVWISLYILMGVSLYLVWRKGLKEKGVKDAILTFLAQLILNALWSVAFFGLKSPLAGLIVITLLWLAIVLSIIRFRRISKPAAILLIPYILWVSFAAVLNLTIFAINP